MINMVGLMIFSIIILTVVLIIGFIIAFLFNMIDWAKIDWDQKGEST